MDQLNHILPPFGLDPAACHAEPLGNGLINSTYLVTDDNGGGTRYVMQRINTNVFPDVDLLQDNIDRVTAHIRAKLARRGQADIERHCLRFLTNRETGKSYIRTPDGQYWRLMVYIPDSVTVEAVTPQSAEQAGLAFGDFQQMLADLRPLPAESIANFHNMEFRLQQLRDAVSADRAGRLADVRPLVDQLLTDADYACTVERMVRDGLIPLRVCHCDTKVNNMLFDRDGNILCVIDLDTVMPGNILSDYGDFLRTAANTAPEDEPDLDKIAINHDVLQAFTRGYLQGAGDFLTDAERALLPHGLYRFAYMQAVRFLTDHLNGDTYFRIAYPGHNLVRARAQHRLATLARPAATT